MHNFSSYLTTFGGYFLALIITIFKAGNKSREQTAKIRSDNSELRLKEYVSLQIAQQTISINSSFSSLDERINKIEVKLGNIEGQFIERRRSNT